MFRLSTFVMLSAVACLPLPVALGQGGGLRAQEGEEDTLAGTPRPRNLPSFPPLAPKTAETYITVDGRAEIRVQPSEIRLILAVTSEGETAQKCQQAVRATIERLKAAWSKIGIAPEKVVSDFIAVIPRYAWTIEKRQGVEVAVENRIGYRTQTNLHLAVRNESEADAAMAHAFELGVTDIIGFDYWSKELDDIKTKARAQAAKAARSKADALFSALFRDQPLVINVQEQTTVHYPESLYHTVSKTDEETVPWNYLGERIPRFPAYRPRHTYYCGMFSDGDVQPRDLPMNPEVSVVSMVRLYFKSPAATNTKEASAERKPQ